MGSKGILKMYTVSKVVFLPIEYRSPSKSPVKSPTSRGLGMGLGRGSRSRGRGSPGGSKILNKEFAEIAQSIEAVKKDPFILVRSIQQ